jgi:hypothetical protein
MALRAKRALEGPAGEAGLGRERFRFGRGQGQPGGAEAGGPIASVQGALEGELQRLKDGTGLCPELSVRWLPGASSSLAGEVEGNSILIYASDSRKAVETLRHEFIDHAVSKAIEPYMRATALYRAMVNAVIEQLGRDAYEGKERAVEGLRRLLDMGPPHEDPP